MKAINYLIKPTLILIKFEKFNNIFNKINSNFNL